jgi:hypothetical protein
MTRSLKLLAVLLAATGGLSCSSLLSTQEFAAALLLETPAVQNPSNSSQTIPGVTTFSLYLGSVDPTQILSGSAPSGAVTLHDDAQVTLAYTDATTHKPVSVSVPSAGAGTGSYTTTSVQATTLAYEQVQYTVTIIEGGSTYILTGTPPTPQKIKEFESSQVLSNTNVSNGFTLTRDPETSPEPVAFVAMEAINSSVTADPSALESGLTYTNAPTDALGFLNLLLSPGPWETDTFSIPGSAFSDPAQTPYLISLTPTSQGALGAGSASLFPGSNFLIGQASAGVVISS